MSPPTTPQRRAQHSLKRRLLLSVLSAVALAALLQASSAYRSALQQADEMFDYHLQQMAYSMRARSPLGLAVPDTAEDDVGYIIQIWGADGAPLFRSPHAVLPPRAVLGFSDVVQNNTRYRVYSIQTPAQTIQIAQDLSARQSRASALAVRAILPMALTAPLLMLVIWLVIRQSLAPLERTRQQVANRPATDLSPLLANDLPQEVQPLVQELNLLFDRMGTVQANQKAFIANAAHELRTPLTGLKLQAQALQRTQEPAVRDTQIGRLNQGIDRAIRLLNQLLALARQESQPAPDLQPLDLQALAHGLGQDLQALAQARDIQLDVAKTAPTNIHGDVDSLRMLLRNLLENAVKYTPTHGRVKLSVRSLDGAAAVVVEDSGPGIPAEERKQVFERFFRSTQTPSGTEGSGLGLSIVKTIADQHGATLALDASPELGGLRVTLGFPGNLAPR
ncbi:ATP-binding protein [Variovorax sp. HJSM1_2]|uniref:sensor histidine kinase n=1 Tax=Variovorax sp. HJSM1_2 TaxID=3366263 RepID=UPI003BD2323C